MNMAAPLVMNRDAMISHLFAHYTKTRTEAAVLMRCADRQGFWQLDEFRLLIRRGEGAYSLVNYSATEGTS